MFGACWTGIYGIQIVWIRWHSPNDKYVHRMMYIRALGDIRGESTLVVDDVRSGLMPIWWCMTAKCYNVLSSTIAKGKTVYRSARHAQQYGLNVEG